MSNQTSSATEAQSAVGCSCTMQLLIAVLFFAGTLRIVRFIYTLLAPYFRRRLELYKRYGGGWAIVTGGSEGIGEGIAS